MNDETNTQLVPTAKPSTLAQLAGVDEHAMSLYTSFDVETEEGKIQTWNAKAEEGIPLRNMLNKPVDIVNLVVYPATAVDTISGEVKKFLRLAIVADDGTIYTGGSEGILKDLGALQSLFGRAPYNPPLRVMPVTIQTQSKRTLFRLKVIGRVEKTGTETQTVASEEVGYAPNVVPPVPTGPSANGKRTKK